MSGHFQWGDKEGCCLSVLRPALDTFLLEHWEAMFSGGDAETLPPPLSSFPTIYITHYAYCLAPPQRPFHEMFQDDLNFLHLGLE